MRQLVKFLKTLFRVLKYGRRDYSYGRLVTPKWARGSMRAENRFKRAMGRPQVPILKRWRLRRFVALNGHLATLERVIRELQEASSFTRWANAFKRRALREPRVSRLTHLFRQLRLRRAVRKNRGLIKNTIEY